MNCVHRALLRGPNTILNGSSYGSIESISVRCPRRIVFRMGDGKGMRDPFYFKQLANHTRSCQIQIRLPSREIISIIPAPWLPGTMNFGIRT